MAQRSRVVHQVFRKLKELDALMRQLGDPTAVLECVHVSRMKRALYRYGYVERKTPTAAGESAA